MALYVYEFLYRGRAPDADKAPAWHLTLVSEVADDFGQTSRVERQFNMAAAAEAGWPLPKIIEAINADLMTEIEVVRAALAGKEAELATRDRELAEVSKKLANLEAERARVAARA